MNILWSWGHMCTLLNTVSILTRALHKLIEWLSEALPFIWNEYWNVSGKLQGPPLEVAQRQTLNDVKGKVKGSKESVKCIILVQFYKTVDPFLYMLSIKELMNVYAPSEPGVHCSFVADHVTAESKTRRDHSPDTGEKVRVGRVKVQDHLLWFVPLFSGSVRRIQSSASARLCVGFPVSSHSPEPPGWAEALKCWLCE